MPCLFFLRQSWLTFLVRGARLVLGTLVTFFAGSGVEKAAPAKFEAGNVLFRGVVNAPWTGVEACCSIP